MLYCIQWIVFRMPGYIANSTVFTMRVTRNSRPDGNHRYNVTLPKQLGDEVLQGEGKTIKGVFDLDVVGWHHEHGESYPDIMLILTRETNPLIGTQRILQDAKWQKLFCLECGRDIVLMFPPDKSEMSYLGLCECGTTFYCDKRDQTMTQLGERAKNDMQILHNYDIRTGMHASDLHLDFDIESGELYHVFFSKIGIIPPDIRELNDVERERLREEHITPSR